jgi:formamidopyrimidine-DNA glycosylase
MNEFPEIKSLERQAGKLLAGKKIANVLNSNSPHKFAFFTGNPLEYGKLLKGRTIESAQGVGIFLDIVCDGGIKITSGDGANLLYGKKDDSQPSKYQLLLEFEDGSWLAYTVAMYGFISVYQGENEGKYYKLNAEGISPLSNKFSEAYYKKLIKAAKPNLSAKAFLATEQRIPGVGNGVLQDILFNCGINPKRKLSDLSEDDLSKMFASIKATLADMLKNGGRNTEKDIFGKKGGYQTLLSKNTYKSPCPKCGRKIVKEAYLGGSVYYCTRCQPV